MKMQRKLAAHAFGRMIGCFALYANKAEENHTLSVLELAHIY